MVKTVNDTLGAFCTHDSVHLPGSGTGPLAGLTFAAKDLYDVAGHVTGCGNPDWLATHDPAERTAPAVQRLLDAGAELAGKTHTDELAYSLNGENAHYGTPTNPNAPGRIPGGSSSGSASAVAGGLVDFALGSDTGGSVRVPASYCGIFGLRPTHGRVPLEHAMPLAPSFDTAGWFAPSADMLARVGEVLLDTSVQAAAVSPARLLLAEDAFALLGDAERAALHAALPQVERRLELAVEPVVVGDEGLEPLKETFRLLQAREIWRVHGEWVTRVRPTFGPGVKERFAMAQEIATMDLREQEARRERFTERMAGLLAGGTLLVLPTAACAAPPVGLSEAELNPLRGRSLTLTSIAGLARLPQVTLPLATVEGLPLGLSLVAASGGDETLLQVARRVTAV